MNGIQRTTRGLSGRAGQGLRRFSRQELLKGLGALAAGAALLGAGGWAYARRIEPAWLEITQVALALPRLDPAFAGFRLAQASDFHLGEHFSPQRLAAALERALDQRPDLLVLTGDYIDKRSAFERWLDPLLEVLRPIAARVPVVAVRGNHDVRVGADLLRRRLAEAGVRLLLNETLRLERGQARLHIAGLDDVWRGRPDLNAVLAGIPPGEAAILLAHAPDYAAISARSGRFDLQLSGHTHGGQVALPLFGRPVLPVYGEQYPSGLYQVNGMIQYTNRGLGTTRPHLRFNCRPEITIFSLYPAQAGSAAGR